jgi:NADPH-ferrihemoprotein reductase
VPTAAASATPRWLEGVASHTLARAAVGDMLSVFVRRSTFVMPPDPATPMVMVGPGTGVAPMRALLQERRHQRVVEGAAPGPTHLFFGCRRRDEDYVYRDDIEGFLADGTLHGLHLAFSREQERKVYVQHRLEEAGALVWDLLATRRGYLYVCGATRMGHDVAAALEALAQRLGGMDAPAAHQWVRTMQTEGRYIQELWS